MNSFFASVEQQERPELRNRPVGIVPMLTDNTCCIAASYEAKAFGVKTGTIVAEARVLCPRICLVEARPRIYVQYHHRIVTAVESCLHVDQVCSIDEMYGRLMGAEREPHHAVEIARKVKASLRAAVGPFMRCSIGLAPNAWLAKIASDMRKPDGLTLIPPEQLPDALRGLKLTDLPGIAANMERRLHRHGVFHVHELCRLSLDELSSVWGGRVLGTIWWHQLRGHDLGFRPTRRRTVGHSHVLPPDRRSLAGAHAVLVRLIHKAAARLRRIHYSAGFLTASVEVMDGPWWERRLPLGQCRDTLTMLETFEAAWRHPPSGRPYHVGVVLTNLMPDCLASMPLFPGQRRRNALADAMDRIDAKYGRHTVYFAGMYGAADAAPTRISFTQIPTEDEF